MRFNKLISHSNEHQCPHLVPSVGCPLSSALALILFHLFLPSPSCWMYLCKSELGTKDTLFRFFSCGRQTADFSLTSNPSSARLPSASSFAAWTWPVGDLSITASTKSCAFFSRLKIFCRLPTCHATHLCPSVSPLLSLCFSLSLKSSTPESPKTPSSPWDLEWMTAQLTRLFAPSHTRTWTQPPPFSPLPPLIKRDFFLGAHC